MVNTAAVLSLSGKERIYFVLRIIVSLVVLVSAFAPLVPAASIVYTVSAQDDSVYQYYVPDTNTGSGVTEQCSHSFNGSPYIPDCSIIIDPLLYRSEYPASLLFEVNGFDREEGTPVYGLFTFDFSNVTPTELGVFQGVSIAGLGGPSGIAATLTIANSPEPNGLPLMLAGLGSWAAYRLRFRRSRVLRPEVATSREGCHSERVPATEILLGTGQD